MVPLLGALGLVHILGSAWGCVMDLAGVDGLKKIFFVYFYMALFVCGAGALAGMVAARWMSGEVR
jgi:hypothetical protein